MDRYPENGLAAVSASSSNRFACDARPAVGVDHLFHEDRSYGANANGNAYATGALIDRLLGFWLSANVGF
jgi:hypothetical protein